MRAKSQAAGAPEPKANLTQALLLMAKLTLQMDREMQQMRREDTYIFFFSSKGPGLENLMQATEKWVQTQQNSPTILIPLRQSLLQSLLNLLLTHLTQLGEAQDGSDLQKQAMESQIILPDKTCPYLEWDHSSQRLKVSQKKPLTFQRLHQI